MEPRLWGMGSMAMVIGLIKPYFEGEKTFKYFASVALCTSTRCSGWTTIRDMLEIPFPDVQH